jgi:hypothetical protein
MRSEELAAGPGGEVDPPAAVARPAVSCRILRWSFEVSEPRNRTTKTTRRRQLADHVFSLLSADIVASQNAGGHTRVFVESHRPVSRAAAADVAAEWPWYVRDSFVADVRPI